MRAWTPCISQKKTSTAHEYLPICGIMLSLHTVHVIVKYGIGTCTCSLEDTRFLVRLARHLQRPAGVRWSVKLISQSSVEEANRRRVRSEGDVEGLRHSRGNVRPVHNQRETPPERVPRVREGNQCSGYRFSLSSRAPRQPMKASNPTREIFLLPSSKAR